MNVLGIDFSTQAVDLVYLDEDSDACRWHRIPLPRGAQGVRQLRHLYAWRSELENAGVYLVALEQPMGRHRNAIAALMRVQGAILATLPSDIEVWLLTPAEWKLACGLAGNATKQDVRAFAVSVQMLTYYQLLAAGMDWPQDALDAFCLAYAARTINRKAVEMGAVA